MVVTPDINASSICWGQMKWMCESMPPAVTIIPSPAMISVPAPITMSTPGWMSGLPALPSFAILPPLMARSHLTIPHQSITSALVITVSALSFATRWLCPMPSRITLPPPNLTSSPYTVRSFSTSITRSVSASRTRSPVVGPNISAYAARPIFIAHTTEPYPHPSLVHPFPRSLLRFLRLLHRPIERSHHRTREPVNDARATECDELHGPLLPRLKAHSRTRWNVQP